MPEFTRNYWGRHVRFACEETDLFEEVCALLPPAPLTAGSPDTEFVIEFNQGLSHDKKLLDPSSEPGNLLDSLENAFQMDIACHAPDGVFVHAGAVELDGRCLILPGRSHAGKSTLVHELVERGANYFSDEFAVFDSEGSVQPYLRPISLRSPSPYRVPVKGSDRASSARLSLVVLTRYQAEAEWEPKTLTPGVGLLGLLDNTVSARLSTARDMAYLSKAVLGAQFLEGPRGDAGATAEILLNLLRGSLRDS